MFNSDLETNWESVKAFLDSRKVPAQYISFKNTYWIVAMDGLFQIWCRILIEDPASNEQIDFETNYKPKGNKSFSDSDGSTLQRTKVTETGWQYQLLSFEIETSTENAVYAFDPDGNALSGFTYKMYDSQNQITNDPLLCVKTIVDFEPTYDYELIGGGMYQKSQPSGNMYYSVIGVPDIPAQYGGSKVFVNSIDTTFIPLNAELKADGRASKKLTYNPNLHTNKLRIVIRHDAGIKHKMLQLFEIFKP